MSSRTIVALRVLAFSLALSVAASWPLAIHSAQLFPSASDMPDLNASLWLPWHLIESARAGHSPWSAPGLLWPDGQPIALLVWNLGIQVMQLPFYVFLEPIPAYSLSLVWLAALNGLGGFVLGRTVGGSRASGLLGASLVVFSPFAWNEFVQGRVEQGLLLWVALACAGLLAQRANPTDRGAALSGLSWGMAGVCYWFYGYFMLLLVGALAVEAGLRRRWDWLRGLVVSAAVSAAVAVPFAIPLVWKASMRSSPYQQATAEEHQALLFQVTTGASLGLQHLPAWMASPPQFLRDVVPLTSLIVLLLWAWSPVRRRAAWLGPVAVVGLILSMGPVLQWTPGQPVQLGGGQVFLPLVWMQELLPGFSRLWWPYRFQVFSVLGAAGCGAALVAVLPQKARWATVAVLMVSSLVELRLAQSWTTGRLVWDAPEPIVVPTFFEALSAEPGAHPLLMLPLQAPSSGRVLWQSYHHQPMSTGLGDVEDFLLPVSVVERRQADPALRLLRELAMRPPNAPMPSNLPPLRDPLGELGYHYAVMWRDAMGAQEAMYRRMLGEPDPQYTDAQLLVWSLQNP